MDRTKKSNVAYRWKLDFKDRPFGEVHIDRPEDTGLVRHTGCGLANTIHKKWGTTQILAKVPAGLLPCPGCQVAAERTEGRIAEIVQNLNHDRNNLRDYMRIPLIEERTIKGKSIDPLDHMPTPITDCTVPE